MKYSEVTGHLHRVVGDVGILQNHVLDAKGEMLLQYRLYDIKKAITKAHEILARLQELASEKWEED